MLLSLFAKKLTADGLKGVVEQCHCAAVGFDEELILISKNSHASKLFGNLRRGRSIGPLLSDKNKEALLKMHRGEIIIDSIFKNGAPVRVVAVRGQDCFLAVADQQLIHLPQPALTHYGKASGYDTDIPVMPQGKATPDAEEIIKQASLQGSAEKDMVFDCGDVADKILDLLCKSKIGADLSVSRQAVSRLGIQGSATDFAFLLIYSVLCGVPYADRDGIGIKFSVDNGRLKIGVTSGEEITCETKLCKPKDGKTGDWLRNIRLIADINLWATTILTAETGIKIEVNITDTAHCEECELYERAQQLFAFMVEFLSRQISA